LRSSALKAPKFLARIADHFTMDWRIKLFRLYDYDLRSLHSILLSSQICKSFAHLRSSSELTIDNTALSSQESLLSFFLFLLLLPALLPSILSPLAMTKPRLISFLISLESPSDSRSFFSARSVLIA